MKYSRSGLGILQFYSVLNVKMLVYTLISYAGIWRRQKKCFFHQIIFIPRRCENCGMMFIRKRPKKAKKYQAQSFSLMTSISSTLASYATEKARGHRVEKKKAPCSFENFQSTSLVCYAAWIWIVSLHNLRSVGSYFKALLSTCITFFAKQTLLLWVKRE